MAEALGVASSVIAVVDLSAKVIKSCVRYAQDVSHAKEDKKRLAVEVTRLNLASVNARELLCGPHGSRLKASHALYLATVNSQSQLRRIESLLAERSGQGKVSFEALKWPFKSKDVQLVIQDLDRCTKAIYSALEVDQTSVLLDIDHKIALDTLPIAEGASFDSHAEEHNPTCLPNTREELLREIDSWIDGPKSKTIFWLNGMAGTGKSTISRTVARSRSKQGDLGASFFFKRGETDRGNSAKFVPTVARRLAWSTPEVASFIKTVVDADPAIVDKTVREQFEKLILEPLSKATAASLSRPSVVIVVDALDECERDADIKLLLELFSALRFAGPLRVRVFISSRPELPVRLGFSSIGDTHQDVILHKIPQPIIEHDISVFLRHGFASIRNRFNEEAVDELKLPVDWPGESNLDKLTRAAVPLFIFAATLCRFVSDSCLGSPDELLQSVLHIAGTGQASKLDMTYSPVLKQQVVNRPERERCDIAESFRLIVGTIVTLARPLSMRALALLLDVHVNKVMTRLRVLHSVLDVPDSLDSPVRLLHLSFRDYLIDPEGKETVEFWVDEKVTHRRLAEHCLRVMRGALRKNICSLPFPGMHRSAVGTRQLEERLPLEVQYACMYWIYHQTKVDFEPNDHQEVYDFMTTHFLHWVEALSLMGRVGEGLGLIRSLMNWLEYRRDLRLSHFLADAVPFLQAHFSVIDEAPLQLYSSALAFSPERSIVRTTFEHCIPKWLSIWPQVKEEWDACLFTLEGHRNSVESVAFSHDSSTVASGSHDKTIRIWDAKTGRCKHVLEGHSRWINSVVFSDDSTLAASGSDYGTVRIWDVKTGKCKHVLEGHIPWIDSVVCSDDLTLVASRSSDGTVWIWDAKTGECMHVLEGHTNPVASVVFSHDLAIVASGSRDKTVRIWDAKTGECEHVLEGHADSVWSVAFSYNSTLVASGSRDKTVRIWDAKTGECIHVLKGHTKSVNSAVFSYDLTMVASGSDDGTVRIWDAKAGECKYVLEGHTNFVRSVTFSYDSMLVASGSRDKTVRVWDAKTGIYKHILEGHADSVWSVVLSKDSKLVASGSRDKTVRIWDVKMGGCKYVLKGHTNFVRSVAFSYDSMLVASGSRDKTVRIWDVKTGKCKHVLEGHTKSVNSAVFSYDSTMVASGSDDETVRIWNVNTGKCENVLEGHSLWVNSVVFSDDSTMMGSGSSDKTVRIWDAKTGKCEHVLEGHTQPVYSVMFSYDSATVASASGDKTVRIWITSRGTCKDVIFLDSLPDILSFTPDDSGIVTSTGILNFSCDSLSSAKLSTLSQPSVVSGLGQRDETWVTMGGRDLLWLPTECREGITTVAADTFVIGCESGRVIVLGFCIAEIGNLCMI